MARHHLIFLQEGRHVNGKLPPEEAALMIAMGALLRQERGCNTADVGYFGIGDGAPSREIALKFDVGFRQPGVHFAQVEYFGDFLDHCLPKGADRDRLIRLAHSDGQGTISSQSIAITLAREDALCDLTLRYVDQVGRHLTQIVRILNQATQRHGDPQVLAPEMTGVILLNQINPIGLALGRMMGLDSTTSARDAQTRLLVKRHRGLRVTIEAADGQHLGRCTDVSHIRFPDIFPRNPG